MQRQSHLKLRRALVLLGALATTVFATGALASGAIGGGGAVSQYGQAYKQGKVIFFQKVACVAEGCAVSKDAVSADFARQLIASIRTRGALRAEESATDRIASGLSSDEAEKVQHYLARRFNVRS